MNHAPEQNHKTYHFHYAVKLKTCTRLMNTTTTKHITILFLWFVYSNTLPILDRSNIYQCYTFVNWDVHSLSELCSSGLGKRIGFYWNFISFVVARTTAVCGAYILDEKFVSVINIQVEVFYTLVSQPITVINIWFGRWCRGCRTKLKLQHIFKLAMCLECSRHYWCFSDLWFGVHFYM